MGLSVLVGALADQKAHDPEGMKELLGDFMAIDEALQAKGLSGFEEPSNCAVWDASMIGYSGLHALREVAALIWQGRPIPRDILLDGSQVDASDALVTTFLEHLSGKGQFTLVGQVFRKIFKAKEKPKLPPFVHLSVHSDCDGYYVPVAFETPIVPKRVSADTEHLWPLGSVMRLEAEINDVARHLEIPHGMSHDDAQLAAMIDAPDRTAISALWTAQPIAAHACLVLRDACAHSLRTGAAICFC